MKVYIADSDRHTLNILEELVPRIEGINSVSLFTYEGTNWEFLKKYQPDVVIMNNLEHGVLDLSLLNVINDNIPNALKLIYTDLSNKQYLPLCMEFGADHFLYKNSGTEFLRFILTDYVHSRRIEKDEGISGHKPQRRNGFMEPSE